jgi:hypothetical protein
MYKLLKSYRLTVNRGIAQADGIPYRHFKYRGIPFTPVYRASLLLPFHFKPINTTQNYAGIDSVSFSIFIVSSLKVCTLLLL